jgi:protein translocase SecG subunit
MLFPILQIVAAVILIVLILLQERASGLGALMGGDTGGAYQTRRGLERYIFGGTIVMIVVFVALAIAQLVW